MATKTSSTSGLWSAGATWGGSAPAAGDTIVVSAGHTVTFDLQASITVAGTLNPDVSGVYAGSGLYQDKLSYTNGTYFIWYSAADGKWVISGAAGTKGAAYWLGPGVSATPSDASGSFTATGTATGAATATDSTLIFAAMTVNGLLSAAVNKNTRLCVNHNNISVANGGELRWGASGAIAPKEYLAELFFVTTADNVKQIDIANGGKFTVAGDPAYYGSDFDTTLAANWTASGASKTFTVTGDFTSKWAAGHELIVHKNAAWSNINTDCFFCTIVSVAANGGNTDVTINETGSGTFYAGGYVLNVSRNVRIGKLNSTITLGQQNTNRPRVVDANTAAGNVLVDAAQFTGMSYVYTSGIGASFTNVVVRNGGVGFTGIGHTISGVIYSLNQAANGLANCAPSAYLLNNTSAIFGCTSLTVSGPVFANTTAVTYSGGKIVFSGPVYSNQYGTAYVNNSVFTGPIYYNGIAFGACSDVRIDGDLGWSKDGVSSPNASDFSYSATMNSDAVLNSPKLPQSGIAFASGTRNGAATSTTQRNGALRSSNHNQTAGAHYKYDAYGDLIKNTGTMRTGGAGSSIEIVPLSNCNATNYLQILEWTEDDVPASEQTRTVYMKGEGWSSFPTNAQLYFEATYFNNASTFATTTAVSTATLSDNTTWVAFPATFTPARVGKVIYRAYLKTYAASSKVYLDAALYRTGLTTRQGTWKDGECQLSIDQTAYGFARGR